MAERHSIFVSVFPASFSLLNDNYFKLDPEMQADYMMPFGFPLSVGLTLRTMDHTAIGLRLGYHINLNVSNIDAYVLYAADLVAREGVIKLEYGPGIGVRRRFGRFFCLHLETGHKFEKINLGLSMKLN